MWKIEFRKLKKCYFEFKVVENAEKHTFGQHFRPSKPHSILSNIFETLVIESTTNRIDKRRTNEELKWILRRRPELDSDYKP